MSPVRQPQPVVGELSGDSSVSFLFHSNGILRFRIVRLVLSLLPLVLASGCQTGTTLIRSPSMLLQDPGQLIGRPRYERNLAKIVTIWEPSDGKNMEGGNSRGFAGQILFFGTSSRTGARVRGRVVISLYDNYDLSVDEEPEPLHQFEFDAEAWEMHRGEGTLGHSYSVFIPYVNPQNKDQVNCALRVEIFPEGGMPVASRETEVMLPGRNTINQAAKRSRGFVRDRVIEPKLDPQLLNGKPESVLETMTIPLPSARRDRSANAGR